MRRDVLLLPHPTLTNAAAPVRHIDASAQQLAEDLVDTMRATSHSVGVAAPQIGISLQAFCVDVTGHPKAESSHGRIVLFNPEILVAEEPHVGREGCMSVPDLTGDVARATRLVVRGVTPVGTSRVIEADAFEARALMHEIDHLRGHVFLDRVVAGDRVFRRKVYR